MSAVVDLLITIFYILPPMNRQHDASASVAQHFLSATTPSSSFSQTTFPSPLFSLDQNLHATSQHLQPITQHGQQSPGRRTSVESQQSMQPPSTLSPRLNRSTPSRKSSEAVRSRALPPRDVTAETITDAYVAFILYCNPQFPLDVDTEALRTGFNTPPKSDNKNFESFRLYELIRKFDTKEIKTWGQLALELGVETPDTSKGQSVQKVQQYSVRLKRWMRAMHIDAFFEYLLGKQHAYFTDIPPSNDPYPATGRDGVMAEEDLAIRALDPSFRPKRGRRRNSETDQDASVEVVETGSKQPGIDDGSSLGLPISAYPASAHPDNYSDPWQIASAVTSQTYAPWANRMASPQTAVAATAPSHLRWQLHGSSRNVTTPHPMTAQPTSMAAHIEAAFDADDASKMPRKRRKHGPAVSSAWPSTNTPGAKPRGRPPASRNMQDGPFGTFPADPSYEKPSAPMKQASAELTLPPEQRPVPQQMLPPLVRSQSDGLGRPGKLSLQVPQHVGGPVRLATPPPPRVLVNGESDDSDNRSKTQTPTAEASRHPQIAPKRRVANYMHSVGRNIPGFAFEVLKRVLTSDLLRADVIGRQQRLSSDEAKRLSDAILQRLGVPREDTEESRDDIARLTAASWLGLGEQLNVPLGPATSPGKRITVTRFRTDAEGYEEIISGYDDADGNIREIFDLSWTVSIAGCNGDFELKGLTLGPSQPVYDQHDLVLEAVMNALKPVGNVGKDSIRSALQDVGQTRVDEDENVDWKAKCMAMEFGARVAMGEMTRMKNRLTERILDILLNDGVMKLDDRDRMG